MKARILAALLLCSAGLTGCISGSKQFVYVTGPSSNQVFGFRQNGDGSLTQTGNPTFATGSQPSAIVIHPPGDFAYITNFAGNNVTLLDVNTGNGELTVPVSTLVIPPPTPPNIFNAGTGPIAMAIAPGQPFLYVLNQGSADISAYSIDTGNGNLSPVGGSPFNTNISPSPQAIAITPKANFVYVANPAASTITGFAIDGSAGNQGKLLSLGAPFSTGAATTPTFITIDPSGRFLFATDTAHNAVLGFNIASNGALAPMSGSPFPAGLQPKAITIDPGGSFLFAANFGSNDVSAYVIDSGSGALGQISGSPFATGGTGPGFLTTASGFLYVADTGTNDVITFLIETNGKLTRTGTPLGVPVSATWMTSVSL